MTAVVSPADRERAEQTVAAALTKALDAAHEHVELAVGRSRRTSRR